MPVSRIINVDVDSDQLCSPRSVTVLQCMLAPFRQPDG